MILLFTTPSLTIIPSPSHNRDVVVLAPVGGAVVRLDVALVGHRGLVFALDHHIRRLEPGRDVALFVV